jgi:hypothetical protein
MATLEELTKKYSLTQHDEFFFNDLCKRWPDLEQYRDNVYVLCGYDGYLQEIPDPDLYQIMTTHIRQGRRIIFYNTPETILVNPIKKIQNILETTQISEKHVFYSTGALDGQEGYDLMFKDFGFTKRMTILSCYDFQKLTSEVNGNGTRRVETRDYEVRLKDKKFLSFNKVDRYHRIYLLAHMLKTGLLHKSFYSFEGSNKNWMRNLFSNRNLNIPEWVFNTIGMNQDIFPLRLENGITEDRTNPIDTTEEDLYYFRNSYFSVVTETLFYNYKNNPYPVLLAWYGADRFLTEKTYKPIISKHPFVMVGRPGFLKILQDYGYKTFHPYIDETYDSIEDDDMRMEAIITEIERLCAFTDNQWIEWQQNIKDIVEYNERYFWNATKFAITELKREWFIDE